MVNQLYEAVNKYENGLDGLLEELNRIGRHVDTEMRKERKEGVKVVREALKAPSPVTGEPPEGGSSDEGVTGQFHPRSGTD